MRDGGYYLPGCVVLAAAIIGTTKAYNAAMALLPIARAADSHLRRDDRQKKAPLRPGKATGANKQTTTLK